MEQEKLWNANYWKVMIANFAMSFAFYLLTPLLPLYLNEHFGATKDLIGFVLPSRLCWSGLSAAIWPTDSPGRRSCL